MAEILELPELGETDGVAEVDVGRGGIDAELHAQRPPFLQLLDQLLARDDLGRAAREALELFGGSDHGRSTYS